MTTHLAKAATTLLTCFLALVLLASAAAAAPVTTPDPANDGHGPGDIRAQKLFIGAGPDIVFQIRTQRGLNLDTAPAWQNGANTQLRINIETEGNGTVDFAIVIEPSESGVVGNLIAFHPLAPEGECIPALIQPQGTVIQARVPYGCLDSPLNVRAFTRYRLDRGGDGSINSDDRAPNNGYGAALALV